MVPGSVWLHWVSSMCFFFISLCLKCSAFCPFFHFSLDFSVTITFSRRFFGFWLIFPPFYAIFRKINSRNLFKLNFFLRRQQPWESFIKSNEQMNRNYTWIIQRRNNKANPIQNFRVAFATFLPSTLWKFEM